MNAVLHWIAANKPILSLALIWLVTTSLLPRLGVDVFRAQIFALRDALFIDAAEGLVEFNHPAYRLLRSTMNGYIRFAESVSVMRALLFKWKFDSMKTPMPRGFDELWADSIMGLEPEKARKLTAYREKMDKHVGDHLVQGNFVLMMTLVPWILALILISKIWARIHEWFGTSHPERIEPRRRLLTSRGSPFLRCQMSKCKGKSGKGNGGGKRK